MTARFTTFSPQALAFLRALKRHNDRDWFRERKHEYERLLKTPMTLLVERLGADLRRFAPQLVANPKTAIYRIYRDTRFSEDKTPLKTHIAAIFPCRGLPKHQGAGLYLEVSAARVFLGGGLYMPDPLQLQRVREHIAVNHRRLRSIVESPAFRRAAGPLRGEGLQRMPRGFDPDHPAAEYLKLRQFLAGRELPSSLATSPRFYGSVLNVFRQMAPFITFLNEPIAGTGPGRDLSS